ncbi:MAG: hypothetical protein M0Z30_13635 [Actinomycetota bacterium]|nr:hypothetical protein [Actinomycetota bacterium]
MNPVQPAGATLGEVIDVAEVDTVVRLDGTGGRLGELVLTGDVIDSLTQILGAAAGNHGAGFFVVGPFGSGKSHFLAAAGELLARPDDAAVPARLGPAAAAVAPFISVAVPLVDYRSTSALERPETAALADTVVAYHERAAGDVFDPEDARLALRTVKLLCLLAASPLERARRASELAGMLLVRASDLDPAANAAYLEQAVLVPLVERGAYVVASDDGTYSVEAQADAAVIARDRVAQARAETSPSDRRMVATLVGLGSSPQLPLQLLSELGPSRRDVIWHNTLRAVLVAGGRVLDLTPADAAGLAAQARAVGAEGCLLVAEAEPTEGPAAVERAAGLVSDRLSIWVTAPWRPEEVAAGLELHARARVLDAARVEGRGELVEVLERSADADRAVARDLLRRVYFDGSLLPAGTDLPALSGLAFDRQLPSLADPMLAGLHPRHREVAPRGELVGDRLLRQLVGDVVAAGRLSAAALARDRLRPLVEGYLVPLGLARLRADGALIAPDPARAPAVAEVLRLVGSAEPVAGPEVLAELAGGPFGLTGPEAVLVLNACVQTGLIEMWRGRRRSQEPFLSVIPADRFGPGELVGPAVRRAVAELSPLSGPGPFEPWPAAVQGDAWDRVRAWLTQRREDLAEVRSGLAYMTEVAAFSGVDATAPPPTSKRWGRSSTWSSPARPHRPGWPRWSMPRQATTTWSERAAGSARWPGSCATTCAGWRRRSPTSPTPS